MPGHSGGRCKHAQIHTISPASHSSHLQVPQRVLLLAGQLDLVIPSRSEGPRVQRAMQRCSLRVLPLRSHAMLQVKGVRERGVPLIWARGEGEPLKGWRDMFQGLGALL